MPLTELWDDGGTLTGGRVRDVGQTEIAELLRSGPVQFLVTDPGRKLKWIPTPQRFEFLESDSNPDRAQFPTRQRTSHLSGVDALVNVLILLEKYH
jgi:hypothetical protein